MSTNEGGVNSRSSPTKLVWELSGPYSESALSDTDEWRVQQWLAQAAARFSGGLQPRVVRLLKADFQFKETFAHAFGVQLLGLICIPLLPVLLLFWVVRTALRLLGCGQRQWLALAGSRCFLVFTASTLRETRILRVWEVDIAWVSGAKAEPLLQKDLWDGVLGRASRVLPIQSEDSIGVNISPPTGCHLPPIGLRITVSSSETSAIGDYFKTPKAKTP